MDNSSAIQVNFYDRRVRNEAASIATGEDKFDIQTFCRILIPANDTLVHDQPVREEDKARFPVEWAHYLNKTGNSQYVGTPIEELTILPEQVLAYLKQMHFFTIESLAKASDHQVQGIGMGGVEWRERAKDFIEKGAKLDSQVIKDQQIQINELQAKMAELMAALESKKVGRPRKLGEGTANEIEDDAAA